MQTDFYELKKELINKKVADSIQFLDNVLFNFETLKYCRNFINKLTEEYDRRIKEYHSRINNELRDRGSASITILDNSFEILGLTTDLPFLISKYIKDIIQYANNILDSLAQLVNCALIYPQYPKDKVDFGFLNKSNRIVGLQSVEKAFENISNASEFSYLRKSNNRIKHIMDIPTTFEFNLFDDKMIGFINSFEKNGLKFKDVKINDKCNNICTFMSDCIDNVCSAIMNELVLVNHKYRFNKVNIYGQIVKNSTQTYEEIDLKNADFLVVYIEIDETDISKTPSQIELLYAEVRNDNIEVFNYDYDFVLIKAGENFVGYAEAAEPIDENYKSYRKYNVILDDKKFYELVFNKTKMKIYPFASNGKIVIYNKENEN